MSTFFQGRRFDIKKLVPQHLDHDRAHNGPNRTEAHLRHILTTKGFRVTRRGWPDFLAIHPKTGRLLMVEVKRGAFDRPTKVQSFVLELLASYGIPVFVWTPDLGFRRVKPKLRPGGANTGG